MQFKTLFVFALPVFAAPAPIINAGQATAIDIAARDDSTVAVERLEKREIITALVTAAAISAASTLATEAAKASVQLIKDMSNWTSARESFTKETVNAMWSKNPDSSKYAAAICNNVGYSLKDPKGMTGLVSVNLKSGSLKTDYDCFYLAKGNTFNSAGDGGYINLATKYSSACKFTSGSKPSLAC